MKRAVKSISKDTSQEIDDFESHLATMLKPVRPPDQFVRDLREKLLAQMEEGNHGKKISTKNLILLILTGLLSLVLIVATAVRLFVSLLVGVKLFERLRTVRGKKEPRSTT